MNIPYGVIADCFRDRAVIPFLGAAASFAGASGTNPLPGGKALADLLATKSAYPGQPGDPLTKIAQYLEEVVADRPLLLRYIADIFGNHASENYSSCLTEFLTQLPLKLLPELIVTTNYDTLTERALEIRRVPYISISRIMRRSKYDTRWTCYSSLHSPVEILPRTKLQNLLNDFRDQNPISVIIYKMHGTANSIADPNDIKDTIVLTETDYVDFLATDVIKAMPTRILQRLHEAHLLFLGYSLEDWNFRVLLQRLRRIQRKQDRDTKRHWACIKDPDPVETKFWDRRGVNLYAVGLEEFLRQIVAQIALKEPSS